MSHDIRALEIILKIFKETNDILNKEDLSNERIGFFRDEIRKTIFFLQDELSDKYSETIMKFVIFPLIAFIDEKILFKHNNQDFDWHILQLEYYNQKNGGEYVFEIIELLLSDTIYPIICYQTMFLILEEGFLGKYYERTFDHNYLLYKKKIKTILTENNKFKEINYVDSDKIIVVKNKLKFNLIAVSIPILLGIISIIFFII